MTPARWVAGVDACRAGWIACFLSEDLSALRLRLAGSVAEVADAPEAPAAISVDMPIGLPERIEGSGRACEMAVRPLLGERQSSVFSTPSRRAVMEADYRKACDAALATSRPPRKVSKQGFMLFPRMRELDALMIARPELRSRIFETHPEVSFFHLNGKSPAALPKKVKSRPNPAGLKERTALLLEAGLPEGFAPLVEDPPRGAGGDDVLDAVACAWSARRILNGEAAVYPDPPPHDAHGIEMAIRA